MLLALVHYRSQELKSCKEYRSQVLEKVSTLHEPVRTSCNVSLAPSTGKAEHCTSWQSRNT